MNIIKEIKNDRDRLWYTISLRISGVIGGTIRTKLDDELWYFTMTYTNRISRNINNALINKYRVF